MFIRFSCLSQIGYLLNNFEVIVVSVVKFLVTCLVSEIFEDQMSLAIRHLFLYDETSKVDCVKHTVN